MSKLTPNLCDLNFREKQEQRVIRSVSCPPIFVLIKRNPMLMLKNKIYFQHFEIHFTFNIPGKETPLCLTAHTFDAGFL